MGLTKRQDQIVAILRDRGRSPIAELAGQLDVPEETVRRDISVLEELELVHRYNGRAPRFSAPQARERRTSTVSSQRNGSRARPSSASRRGRPSSSIRA